MILLKLMGFICVGACCAMTYVIIEFKRFKHERKAESMDRMVRLGIISMITLMFASLPVAFYALYSI